MSDFRLNDASTQPVFFIFPVGMNYRTERLPVVTFSLIAFNTLVYLVSLFFYFQTGGESEVWIYQHLWLAPDTSAWYAYVTSMFVHQGFFHLFGNMIYLFLFGCCVEDLVGRDRYLVFYLVGGFIAELFFIATQPLHFASHVHLGGASGAISACMGMYLCLRANTDITFKYFYFFLRRADYGEWEIPAWMVIGFWFLKDLFWMVIGILFPDRHGGGTAFGAHVGGLLAGMALIALFRLSARKSKHEAPAAEILSSAEIQAAAALNHPAPSILEIPTIYLHADGVQSGPFTLAKIQSRLAQKDLSQEARYWCEGMTQWESIQDLADRPF